jgi:hypothetical protein
MLTYIITNNGELVIVKNGYFGDPPSGGAPTAW